MEKVTPRIDIAFKKLFGVEENKDLLISLINSIVSKEDQISNIKLLNPYNPKNYKKDKLSILDIKAKGRDGKRFNIEIQVSDEADYDKRALYYWAKLYAEQLGAAGQYKTLSKAIGIHILNFKSIPALKPYHNVFKIKEELTNFEYFKDFELHTIELEKFTSDQNEDLNSLIAKIRTSLDRWAAFLTSHDLMNKDNLPQELNDAHLKKALEVLDTMNFTQEERYLYEEHLKFIRMEASAFDKVRADGFKEGIEKGKIEGKIEGKTERDLEIAKNMFSLGINMELIQKATGLSLEQIKELKNYTSLEA